MKANEKFEKLCANYAKNQGRAAALGSIMKSCQNYAMDMELRYGRIPNENGVTEHIAEISIYKIRMYMAQMEEYLKSIEETFICGKEEMTNEENP